MASERADGRASGRTNEIKKEIERTNERTHRQTVRPRDGSRLGRAPRCNWFILCARRSDDIGETLKGAPASRAGWLAGEGQAARAQM